MRGVRVLSLSLKGLSTVKTTSSTPAHDNLGSDSAFVRAPRTSSRKVKLLTSSGLSAAFLLSSALGAAPMAHAQTPESAASAAASSSVAPSQTQTQTQTETETATPSQAVSSEAVKTEATQTQAATAQPSSTTVSAAPAPKTDPSVTVAPSSAPISSAPAVGSGPVASTSATAPVKSAVKPQAKVAAGPVAAAAAVPSNTVTLTNGGNTFNFSVTTLSDGTGQGTAAQCFINSANGYTPGDNTATDGYACLGDSVTYRVDWNANIVDTSTSKVNFDFKNLDTSANSYIGYGPDDSWNWSGGITGGSALGFSGAGTGHIANMTFTRTGALSGYWTFTRTYADPTQANHVDTESATAEMGSSRGVSTTDRPVTLLAGTRVDAEQSIPNADSTLTTINGQVYRGINLIDKGITYTGTDLRIGNIIDPNYANNKGYVPTNGNFWVSNSGNPPGVFSMYQLIDRSKSQFRYSMENADPTVMVAVNGGTPVKPSWNGTTAYIDALPTDQVKFFVPWGSLADGNYTWVTRVDPLSSLIDIYGNPTLGGKTDPGVGLACDVSTKDVLPGSRAGSTIANNNCAQIKLAKLTGGGGIGKALYYPADITLTDGTVVHNAKRTGTNGSDGGLGGSNSFRARLTVNASAPGTMSDALVCDVWDKNQQMLDAPNNQIKSSIFVNAEGVPVTTVVPGMQIYYATKDLRPAGAPTSLNAPNCGSPSDTSTWSLTPPADPHDISGVLFTLPGNGVASALNIELPMHITGNADYWNKQPLVVQNVRDYMGMAPVGATPQWIGSSAALNVVSRSTIQDTVFETNSSLPIGQTTYTTSVAPHSLTFGSPIDGQTMIQRIYVDNCMLNPKYDPSTLGSNVLSYKFVDNGQDSTKCGTLSNSYFEVEMKIQGYDGSLGRAAKVTWTTPVTSAPGDQYQMNVKYAPGQGTDNIAFSSPSAGNTKLYTVAPSAVIGSTKVVDDPHVEINAPYSDTIGWFNYSPQDAGQFQIIDVLPYNGDARGTALHGTDALSSVTYTGKTAEDTTVEYTKAAPASVSDDPKAASNTNGTTVWCVELSGGNCPANMGEVTAVRFTTANLNAGENQYYKLTFAPKSNIEGDVYGNKLGQGIAANLGQPVPASPVVKTDTFASSLSGYVFNDANNSASWDDPANEKGLPGYKAELLDANGKSTGKTVTTDNTGFYKFDNIVHGDYQVKFTDPTTGNTWTVVYKDTGVDAADGTTGAVTVGLDTDVVHVDAGVYQARPITIHKADANGALTGAEFAIYNVDPSTVGAQPMANSTTVDPSDASTFHSVPLGAGSYWLVETKAPEGHNLLAKAVPFTVDSTGITLGDVAGNTATVTISGADKLTMTITDVPVLSLPQTGGEGMGSSMLPWMLMSGAALAAAGITVARRKVDA